MPIIYELGLLPILLEIADHRLIKHAAADRNLLIAVLLLLLLIIGLGPYARRGHATTVVPVHWDCVVLLEARGLGAGRAERLRLTLGVETAARHSCRIR